MALLKKKGIIGLLFIFIMSVIGCGNNTPKDIDDAIYKKSVEMLAYTERCFNNDTNADDEKYGIYSEEVLEICKSRGKDITDKERDAVQLIALAGLKLLYYQTGNEQEALDYYNQHIKDAKKALNIPTNTDSNEVWDKIKDK